MIRTPIPNPTPLHQIRLPHSNSPHLPLPNKTNLKPDPSILLTLQNYLKTYRNHLEISNPVPGFPLIPQSLLYKISKSLNCFPDSDHVIGDLTVGELDYRVFARSPPTLIGKERLESKALFVLLVQTSDTSSYLLDCRFPCIVVSASGSRLSRYFVKKISSALRIAVFGLVDSPPFGVMTLWLYMCRDQIHKVEGCPSIPRIKWLGLSEPDFYGEPSNPAGGFPFYKVEEDAMDMIPEDVMDMEGFELWKVEVEKLRKKRRRVVINRLTSRGLDIGWVEEDYAESVFLQ